MSSIGKSPSDMSLNNAADSMSDWDGFSDVMSSIGSFANGVSDLAGDISDMAGDIGGFASDVTSAVQSFLNPGGVSSPTSPSQATPGYGAGQASGPNDTGLPSTPPASGAAQSGATEAPPKAGGADGAGGADAAGGDDKIPDTTLDKGELDAILGDKSMSVEDKIFAVLCKMQEKGSKNVEDFMGKGKKLDQGALQKLQKAQGDLTSLQSMATNLLQMWHQANQSTIQNLR